MKNTLISMTDFVFLTRENKKKDNIIGFWACERYAKFLSQPLQKWMFVPCGEDGEVLDFPTGWGCGNDPNNPLPDEYMEEYYVFNKAKERCLFEGLTSIKINDLYFIERDNKSLFCTGLDDVKTIEDLVNHDLILTATALKQIEL